MFDVLFVVNKVGNGDIVLGLDINHLGGGAGNTTQVVGVLGVEVSSDDNVLELIDVIGLHDDGVQVLDFNVDVD